MARLAVSPELRVDQTTYNLSLIIIIISCNHKIRVLHKLVLDTLFFPFEENTYRDHGHQTIQTTKVSCLCCELERELGVTGRTNPGIICDIGWL